MRIVHELPHPVREIEHCWIPMADGCRLSARLWLPCEASRAPVPVVLEIVPYRKRVGTRFRDETMHRWFAGHGVAAARVDVRGSGESEGLLEDEYSAVELADAEAVIAWLASRSWCSGAVGMIGKSWGGIVALALAARRPPALRAIVTVCSSDDRYGTDAHYMGGCLLAENLLWGSSFTTLAAMPPDPEIVGEGWRDIWQRRLAALRPFAADWMRRPRRDESWRRASVVGELERIEVPVLAVGGWADAYTDTVFRLLEGLAVPRRGIVGPWAHLYPHDADPGPEIGFLQEALAWWRRWLTPQSARHDPSVVATEPAAGGPALAAWMPESYRPGGGFPDQDGRWVAEAEWPSPRIARRVLHLAAGRLTDDATAGAAPQTVRSPQTVGRAAGRWCAFGEEADAPGDQRLDDAGSLIFDAARATTRIELLGRPAVELELAVDRPRALVAVRLSDVAPDGSATRIAYGVHNLALDLAGERPSGMVPGARLRLRLELTATAWSLAPGHRLRLALSTAYWPLVWPSPEPVTLTLFPGACRLELPLRTMAGDEEPAPVFAPAEGAASAAQPVFAGGTRRRTRGDPTGYYEVEESSGETASGEVACVHLRDIDLHAGQATSELYAIDARDPLRARIEVRHRGVLARGDWRPHVESRWRLTADATHFRLEGSVAASLGDEAVAERRWDERIPRDLL